MGSRFFNFIRIALLLAFLVAAAATPKLAEAKPAQKSAAKSPKKKPAKKMKISFDGGSSSSSNEPLRPKAVPRNTHSKGETVQMRAHSIDHIWDQQKGDVYQVERYDEPEEIQIKAAKPVVVAATPVPKEVVKRTPVLPKKAVAKFEPVREIPVRERVVIAKAQPELDFEDVTPEARARKAEPKPIRMAQAPQQPYIAPRATIAAAPTRRVRTVPREAPARPYVADSARLETLQPMAFRFDAALENTVTLGRTYELQEEGGRNFAMRNELFLGVTEKSGWGAKISGLFVSTSNADSSRDFREIGDPSLVISHPSLYKSQDLDIYGRFRYYAPVSTASSAVSLHHFAYYLFADLTLPNQMAISNAFIPRYFNQAEYSDTDAYALIYDATEFTKQLDSNFRLGIGQQTQIETHHFSATGTSIEAYPFIDFIGISNTLLQAKMYFPLYVNNSVGGAPTAAGVSNLQAEFFAKISF